MTTQLGTIAAGKLLVSIFSALNPVCEDTAINENTAEQVKVQLENIGFDINLPVKIRLADDYAELFAHILGEVNDSDIAAYAHKKAAHAANYAANNCSDDHHNKFHSTKQKSCDEKVQIAKSVIANMQEAKLIEVSPTFLPQIR